MGLRPCIANEPIVIVIIVIHLKSLMLAFCLEVVADLMY